MEEIKKIQVLISYAWESEEFRNSIWELGSYIHHAGNGNIIVRSDHLNSVTPDPRGWDIWMRDEVMNADVVLSVCSPKYYNSFIRNYAAPVGAGVCIESTYIMNEIKESRGINQKYYPILPQNGEIKNIPELLRPYNNSFEFPRDNSKIVSLIKKENPSYANTPNPLLGPKPEDLVKLEKQIIDQIKEGDVNMDTPIKIIIRAYLSLSEMNKLGIASKLLVPLDILSVKPVPARDLKVMNFIKTKELLFQLWEEVSQIMPLEIKENPFKKITK